MNLPILGKHSPRLKELRLLETPAGREQAGRYLLEGVRVVEEALEAGAPLELLLVAQGASPAAEALAGRAMERGAEVCQLEAATLERLAPARTSQGLLGVARLPARTLEETLRGDLVLVLEGIQDPGNVGTLLRTARAAGAGGAILLGGADAWNPRTVRSAAGAIFRLPLVRLGRSEGPAVMRALERTGHVAVAAEAHGGEDLYRAELPGRMALVLGAEVDGVSAPLQSSAALRLTIPLAAGSESLNVAAAGAVVLFELRRREITRLQGIP